MTVSANQVKELREKTGAGLMDCKNALSETGGDFEKAIEFLRKKGMASAAKKAGRATSEGVVSSYIHAGGRVGVLLEVNCETDFVARNEKFQNLVKDLGMQIAAANPLWVSAAYVPPNVVEKEKEIAREQMKASGKPAQVIDKIAEGKVAKFFEDMCLMEQKFVKDPSKTIQQLIQETVAILGEHITVSRFARFGLGEASGQNNAAAN